MARKRKRSDLRIHLGNQCPRIGSGVRGVQIVSVGPKWVHFRETATQTPGKLSRKDWDRLVRS